MSLEFKIAWEYVWARCDNAGVWSPNFKLADFQIGKKIKWEEFPQATGDRIIVLPSGKWQVKGFVELQCGTNLSPESRPHQAVISLLKHHGIGLSDTLSIEYSRGINTPKDKYTDKEEEKDNPRARNKRRATLEEITEFCLSVGLPSTDAEATFAKWEGNGWKNNGVAIADWQATVRSWKAHGYMPSQKLNGSASAKPAQKYKLI